MEARPDDDAPGPMEWWLVWNSGPTQGGKREIFEG